MFRITFLAKTLHKTWYRELTNVTCTYLTKDVRSFRFPEFLSQKTFSRTHNVYFSDLGGSEWGLGVGGLIALILLLPMSL